MAASTVSNSGGPGSPTELSPVTIAVRDKVIEKFQDQPLKEMNESLKTLLSKEQDEQKRLGILAARVYILRQRITALGEPNPERVVSTASPALKDTDVAGEAEIEAGGETNSEWTRLRILDDCEVNGVRFPKTVIIDVKSSDAQRLIDSGNAELVDEQLAGADETAEVASDEPSAMQAELDNMPAAAEAENVAAEVDEGEGAAADTETGSLDELQSEVPVMETSPAPEPDEAAVTNMMDAPATDTAEGPTATAPDAAEEEKEAIIEAPSAAEVTAALAALGSESDALGDLSDDKSPANGDADMTDLSGADDDEAAAVAAELEAAAAAMETSSPEPADTDNTDESGKPGGWFEAQQNAELAAKAQSEDSSENDTGDGAEDSQTDQQEDESPTDEKS